MSINNYKNILNDIKNSLSINNLQEGNGITLIKDDSKNMVTINRMDIKEKNPCEIKVSEINGNIINNDKEMVIYNDFDCMKIADYTSNNVINKSDKTLSINGVNNIQPLQYYGKNSDNEIGFFSFPSENNEKPAINIFVINNAKANQEYVINNENNCTYAITQCWNFLNGIQDIQGTLNSFETENNNKYYYTNNISFNEGIKIKNEYELSFTKNDELYYSEVINKNDYIGGMKVIEV